MEIPSFSQLGGGVGGGTLNFFPTACLVIPEKAESQGLCMG